MATAVDNGGGSRLDDLEETAAEEPGETAVSTRKVILRRAKFNYKYKRRKKPKPRINADDLGAISHMLEGTPVTYTYDPATNDLIFDTHTVASGSDVEIDGEDTGGQMVRSALQLAIQMAGGRATERPIGDLHIRSEAKACMLYVQAAMYTLAVGGSFTIHGGTATNGDAPTYPQYCEIFDTLRSFIGVSYRLTDRSSGGVAQFVLTREADVVPAVDPSAWLGAGGGGGSGAGAGGGDGVGSGDILSYFMMDQLLMALIFIKPNTPGRIQLVCDYDRDYHVAAMVKMLRLVGYPVDDVRSGAQRIVTVHPLGQ
eukprot:gene24199-27486_t